MLTKYFIATLLSFASFNLYAADGCTTPRSQYDKVYCVAKLFVQSDTDLNDTYKNLTKLLTPKTKQKLVKVQRNWIKFRDDSCMDNDGLNVECNYQINKARVTYLEDRLRECKIEHCQENLLTDENFSKN